jgi:asparagine synthase (glutamine-hydrolysing)
MSGIAGVIGSDREQVRAAVEAMNRRQSHRGPDGEGLELLELPGGRVLGLGHRRLAMLDRTATGRQPMVCPATGDALVFAGELWNHADLRQRLDREPGVRFAGTSDAEVALRALTAWGERAIDLFNGMFSLGFLDREGGRVLLARDPIGLRPLYYHVRPGTLVFATELRAVLASGLVDRRIDRRALAGLMAYGGVQDPLTMFEDVRALSYGTLAWIDPARLDEGSPAASERKHWDFPAPRTDLRPGPEGEARAVAELREVLEGAVRRHLMGESTFGVFLSSGLDSTTVTGLAAKHSAGVHTFTVGYSDHVDLSEAEAATETASEFGVRHTNVLLNEPDTLETVRQWIDALDQPSLDGLNVFIVSKAVRAAGMRVALTGLGGDELLCSYRAFADVPRALRVLTRARALPRGLRGLGFEAAAWRRGRSVRSRAGDMGRSGGSAFELCLLHRRILAERGMRRLGLDAAALGLHPTYQLEEAVGTVDDAADRADLVAAVARYESRYYLVNLCDRDMDANSLAHGLEARCPMLDRAMLDLCLAIPGRVRLPEGIPNKHLLRQAFGEYHRQALRVQRKKTFILPIRRWMREPLRDLAMSNLEAVRRSGALEPAGVDWAWREFLDQPESTAWCPAYVLMALGGYLRAMRAV